MVSRRLFFGARDEDNILRMSFRRLLRIGLSVGILAVLWMRVGREWHSLSALWLIGSLTLSLILLLVVVFEVSGVQQKWRRQRDQVPKKPLGLDT
jgi:cell division protein FtsW (lipid II flippase)